ncbi:MAG TPA: response regulator transcription factor [Thermoanaerobaculia bacterium]|nr:response regulator transcription factor [Thermoanaerobaculia bacterium]
MKLLVVEDSERLRRSLGQGLRRAGFAVDLTADGEEGLAFAEVNDYDVIVLDLMLPKLDGLSVLRRLRLQGRKTHVLILSAKDQVEDRIRGLELGADDYLIKPFSFEELCARVRALVRRRYESKDPVLRIADLEIDTARHQASRGGLPLSLTPTEYSLLHLLALRRGRVLSRDQILDHLYDSAADVSSNVVEVLVYSLRKKLQPAGAPPLIVTRRGRGYLIEAP